MGYTDIFGGETIFPSLLSYLKITTAVDVTLQWPREQQIEGLNVVADFLDVDATAPSVNIDLPSASVTSTGNKATINNVGSNAFDVRDSTGGAIQTVQPGEKSALGCPHDVDPPGRFHRRLAHPALPDRPRRSRPARGRPGRPAARDARGDAGRAAR